MHSERVILKNSHDCLHGLYEVLGLHLIRSLLVPITYHGYKTHIYHGYRIHIPTNIPIDYRHEHFNRKSIQNIEAP